MEETRQRLSCRPTVPREGIPFLLWVTFASKCYALRIANSAFVFFFLSCLTSAVVMGTPAAAKRADLAALSLAARNKGMGWA